MHHENLVFHVEGMSCQHCSESIQKALKALEGIDSVAVDLKEKKVTVVFDANKVKEKEMAAAILDQGFEII